MVQGVFFRASAAQIARKLNLSGFVRNLSNGDVEVTAEGEEEMLKKMIEWCRQGPPGARVQNIEIEWNEPTHRFINFQTR